jgi:SAM-dependent methyltransferase
MKNEIHSWYQSDAARTYRQAEAHILNGILPNCFGYHLVQLGGPEDSSWLDISPIKHQILVNLMGDNHKTDMSVAFSSQVRCEFNELPFMPNGVDVFLLPHTLEYCTEPQKVLSQAVQALIPEGYIIILGFNPISLAPLHFLLNKKKPEWLKKLFTMRQMCNWLTLLDCQVDQSLSFTRFNLAQSKARRAKWEKFVRSSWHFFGGLYIIVARKRVAALTPIRLQPRLVEVMGESEHNLTAPTNRSIPRE